MGPATVFIRVALVLGLEFAFALAIPSLVVRDLCAHHMRAGLGGGASHKIICSPGARVFGIQLSSSSCFLLWVLLFHIIVTSSLSAVPSIGTESQESQSSV